MDGLKRCSYPGAISHHTKGEGPWFCRFHFNCGDGVTGARIVEQSRTEPYIRPVNPDAEAA